MKMATCLDTSCWLEWLTAGSNMNLYLPLLRQPEDIIVPTICLYEVGKYVLRTAGASKARDITDWMCQGLVIPLSSELAILSAEFSHQHQIPMADSIIYVTATQHNAQLWSQDDDHKGLPNVNYHPKLAPGH
jgi:predicted nucleic acid-binding protein